MLWIILENWIRMRRRMRIKTGLVSKIMKKPTLQLKGRFFVVMTFIMLFGTVASLKAQSELFKSLKDKYEIAAELYFYASTLRMINISRDPNFDEMVEDIEKMTFYQIKEFPVKEMRAISKEFKEEEGFEELMTVESKEQTLYVLGKSDEEFVALLKNEEAVLAIDLQGMIRIDKIPELINSLNADNFLNVFEFGKSERSEHSNQ